MKYLIDTHYILWTLFEPERIDSDVLAILHDDAIMKYVSGISLWEISLKYSIGKLELSGVNPDDVHEKIEESGFEILPVENHVFTSYYKLPKKKSHKDPFDRILIWQAILNNMVVITKDGRMEDYIEHGLRVKLGR